MQRRSSTPTSNENECCTQHAQNVASDAWGRGKHGIQLPSIREGKKKASVREQRPPLQQNRCQLKAYPTLCRCSAEELRRVRGGFGVQRKKNPRRKVCVSTRISCLLDQSIRLSTSDGTLPHLRGTTPHTKCSYQKSKHTDP